VRFDVASKKREHLTDKVLRTRVHRFFNQYPSKRPCLSTQKKKWVVDADIKGCFDNINHEYLLKTIVRFPARKLIHLWLKAAYVDKGVFHETEAGTPQGGIFSPLLANIVLHGMEKYLGVKYNYRGQNCGKRQICRYADDFVVFCETKEDAEIAKWVFGDKKTGNHILKFSWFNIERHCESRRY